MAALRLEERKNLLDGGEQIININELQIVLYVSGGDVCGS